ncbi:MAG: tRNA uridine-5-carboxymethylaminomethyl(34) synthesis GTPase MnmE [Clostridia bacterium]|nr:tRNA uridine-5-carboxymethylaminomethyl(34) synthesis GTPase MnmE [Clostridia bacterium]
MKTIAAISTAPAVGGIGVIRISGDDAIAVAARVFRAVSTKKALCEMQGYTAAFGYVQNAAGQTLDECVALVFKAPHSFTGEDVVELSCHGGLFLLKKVLEAVYAAGAVPAEAGEFTKRAFLNKKIDLTEAEAVASIIAAQSDASAAAAMSAKEGALFQKISQINASLIALSAHLAAWTDYPDDDIEAIDTAHLKNVILQAKQESRELLETFEVSKIVAEGVETAILGRTNVGKSSLMNLICGEQKSIVTEIEGTTRDVVETSVRCGNVVLKLSDTAGLRQSEDKIEQIGIALSKKKAASAGLIFAVFDTSKPLSQEDFALLEAIKNKRAILIMNKIDLSAVWESSALAGFGKRIVAVSAKQAEGYEALVQAVEEELGTKDFNPYAPLLATARQKNCLATALSCMEEALEAIEAGLTLDAVNVSIDAAVSAFLELTGERATEKITDEIFKHFCVGK